ncbi:MAG: hypothetical protein LUQ65_07300 [Candidatus Helarchaeota archaeon]|nr:hypothetical protein [Candidatus Helarchaeota archaeon]
MALEPDYVVYLISGIFALMIILIAGVILVRSFFKSKNRVLLYFIAFFLLGVAWIIGSTLYPILELNLSEVIFVLAVSSVYIGFFSLFLFLELISSDKINLLRTVFFASLVCISIFEVIISMGKGVLLEYIPNFGYYATSDIIALLLQAILLLGIIIEFIVVSYKVLKVANTKAEKYQAMYLMIGAIICIMGAMITPVLRFFIDFRGFLLLFASIGAAFSGIGLSKNPDVVFVLPFKVQNLLVINASGICLFSEKFYETSGIDDVLVSGMISAITSFMNETFGAKSQLREIIFGDMHVLLDLRKKIGVILVSDASSQVLKDALSKFTDYFESTFSEVPEPIDVTKFSSAAEGVRKFFKFLPGPWKTREISV